MDIKIREIQERILKVFSKHSETFALSGGTALELYYLHHRFSKDLDFFSPEYNVKEIEKLISMFEKETGKKLNLESEFVISGSAKVRFYTTSIKKASSPLKIDFVEDVIFEKPIIKKFNRVPVYDVRHIYIQKIYAITGIYLEKDAVGREMITGRKVVRDVFDIYILSKKIEPLHKFLPRLPRVQQRGVIQWYHSFSRYELKTDILDLDIYDKKFDTSKMLLYLDNEVKNFSEAIL